MSASRSGAGQPVGYDGSFLDWGRPNETYYLSEAERLRGSSKSR